MLTFASLMRSQPIAYGPVVLDDPELGDERRRYSGEDIRRLYAVTRGRAYPVRTWHGDGPIHGVAVAFRLTAAGDTGPALLTCDLYVTADVAEAIAAGEFIGVSGEFTFVGDRRAALFDAVALVVVGEEPAFPFGLVKPEPTNPLHGSIYARQAGMIAGPDGEFRMPWDKNPTE